MEPGAVVRRGDPVAVVETAKSTIEVECFESGTMGQPLVRPGTTVAVGTPLALIETGAEARGKGGKARRSRREPQREPQEEPEGPPVLEHTGPTSASEPVRAREPVVSGARDRGHVEAGPLIRRLAEQSGVDLEALPGSGPAGRVTRADIERATAAAGARPRVRGPPPSPVDAPPSWASTCPR